MLFHQQVLSQASQTNRELQLKNGFRSEMLQIAIGLIGLLAVFS